MRQEVNELCATNLCQARQIHQRQAQNMRRVDFEIDGLPVNALVVSCYPRCLVFDFAPNLGEVVEAAAWDVKELCPFLLTRHARWCMWNVYLIVIGPVIAVAGEVD